MIKVFNWLSKHKNSVRFQNLNSKGLPIDEPERGLKMVREWRARRGEFANTVKTPWPEKVESHVFPRPPSQSQDLHITYINHLTFLIQMNGINILTDPVFSQAAGPYGVLGPKRAVEPGMTLSELPKIDVVLVSHNHYDHMDVPTLEKIAKQHDPVIITGANNSYYMGDISKKIVELKWGEKHVTKDLNIHFARAFHWSGRFVMDKNWALWGSFIIEGHNKKLYFSGDTAFGDHYEDAADKFGGFDVSFLPIGAYEPRNFMKWAHQDPQEAALAHIALKSKLSIASHFGTFDLSDEGIDAPVNELREALDKHKIDRKSFLCLKNGENFAVNTI